MSIAPEPTPARAAWNTTRNNLQLAHSRQTMALLRSLILFGWRVAIPMALLRSLRSFGRRVATNIKH
jgi:hypothetical protein